jgi:hypothetical protein
LLKDDFNDSFHQIRTDMTEHIKKNLKLFKLVSKKNSSNHLLESLVGAIYVDKGLIFFFKL